LSDDRLLAILQSLAVLLFVSVGVLSFGRARRPWARWAKWGAVTMFALAFLYAVAITLRWALGADRWPYGADFDACCSRTVTAH